MTQRTTVAIRDSISCGCRMLAVDEPVRVGAVMFPGTAYRPEEWRIVMSDRLDLPQPVLYSEDDARAWLEFLATTLRG